MQDLIHGEIDGTNSPVDHDEAQLLLQRDSAARAEYEALLSATHLLTSVRQHEPPPDLRLSVMRRLPAIPSPPSFRSAGWIDTLLDMLRRRPALGYAWAVAVGVLLGAIGISIADGTLDQSSQHAVGSMVERGGEGETVASEQRNIRTTDAHGLVRMTSDGTEALVEFVLHAGAPVDVRVTFDEPALMLRRIERRGEARPLVIGADTGHIHFNLLGAASYVLVFDHASTEPPSLRLEILRDGELIAHEAFPNGDL